jgi:hypothetical protein
MNKKLTLKLDKEVIEHAKLYAASNQRSLSSIVESYLKSLTKSENRDTDKNGEISPFVKSMKSGVKLPHHLDEKKEYGNYLAKKHQ